MENGNIPQEQIIITQKACATERQYHRKIETVWKVI